MNDAIVRPTLQLDQRLTARADRSDLDIIVSNEPLDREASAGLVPDDQQAPHSAAQQTA